MPRHTRSNNVCTCYIELKGHFNNEAYEGTKSSNVSAILQNAHYDGNRKFTLNNYYNLVAESFFQFEESGPVYTLKEAQKIN